MGHVSSSENEAETELWQLEATTDGRVSAEAETCFVSNPSFRSVPGMLHWKLMWKLSLCNSCTEVAVPSGGCLPDLEGGGSAPKEV